MTFANVISETPGKEDCILSAGAYLPPANLRVESIDGELVIKHFFDATPEQVFRAWTDPEYVAHWFGPRGVSLSVSELDVRPGGAFRAEGYCTRGDKVRIEGEYHEVVEPDWIVFTDSCFVGGSLVCKAHTAVIFHEQDGGTKLTIHCEPLFGFDAFAQRRWAEGWHESLERLGAHLAATPNKQCEARYQ